MTKSPAVESPGITKPTVSSRRAIAAATVGNALEWFDMTIYALLAIYIGHNFFPSDNESVQLIQTLAVFGVSYVVRPLGGLVIGSFSDRHGVKKGLMLTIRLMVLGTAMIAFMPGHDSIGVVASIGIIIARLIQGFSAGGEFGAATSFLIAQDSKRRGFFGSFQFASQGLGITGAAVFVAVLTANLSEEDMNSWGWRLPFIFGLLVGPVGYFIRRVVEDVPIDRTVTAEKPQPIRELFRAQKLSIVIAGGSLAISTALNFTMQYMPTYGIKELGLEKSTSFVSLVITGVILTFGTPIVGHLSDRYGRLRIMVPSAVVIGISVIPLFMWLTASKTFLVMCIVMASLGLLKAAYFGALPSVMSDAFPQETQATGLSFSYNTTVALFGGFTPMVTAFLIQATGQPVAPGYYLALLSGLSIVALIAGFKFRGIS